MLAHDRNLVRICVFYDGNYFLHISNYYLFHHSRGSRISIRGLHEFIRNQVADEEDLDPRVCHVVDAHYFRGRQSAYEARENNKLFAERQFDDILMNEGVTPHYLPLRHRRSKREEKGVDVWLALEALELTLYKRYDVVVLIASDGDYVPLLRKLNTLGTKVMLLSWDFEFTDEEEVLRETRTSQDLLEGVSYPLAMHELIEEGLEKEDPLITHIFLPQEASARVREGRSGTGAAYYNGNGNGGGNGYSYAVEEYEKADGELMQGIVFDVKKGFGFIEYPPNNLFFHISDLVDTEFDELQRNDVVEFVVSHNDKGPCARSVRKIAVATPTDDE